MSEENQQLSILSVEALNAKMAGYKVTDLIAKNEMGAVYIGLQETLDREVAIKVLSPELTKNDAYNEAFQSKAKAFAKVSHSNLISIYEFGQIDNFSFIVMEFIKGSTLSDVIKATAYGETEGIELIISICRGIEQVHKAGIVHRDVQPSNILIDEQGFAKIGDFGIARRNENTPEEVIFCTPEYTAPEVIENPMATSSQSDIFSVGILLFKILTGVLPDNNGQIPSEISFSNPIFDKIVAKATATVCSDRYSSAEEMAQDLQNALNSSAQTVQTAAPLTAAAQHNPSTISAEPAISPAQTTQNANSAEQAEPKKSGIPVVMLVTIGLLLIGVAIAVKFIAGTKDEFNQHEVVINSDPAYNDTENLNSINNEEFKLEEEDEQPENIAEMSYAASDKISATPKPNIKAKTIDYNQYHPFLTESEKKNHAPVDCPWITMNDQLTSYLEANKKADLNKDNFLSLFEYWDNEWPYKGQKINENQRKEGKLVCSKQYLYMAFPEADLDNNGKLNNKELKTLIKSKSLPKYFQYTY